MEYQLEDKKYHYSSTNEVNSPDGQPDNDHILLDVDKISSKKDEDKQNFLKDSKSSSHNVRHFGTHFPFYFVNNEPVFTIGPDCKSRIT